MRIYDVQQQPDSIMKRGATNPIKQFFNSTFGCGFTSKKTDGTSVKEQLYQAASNLPDGIREKCLEYIEKGQTKRDFIDMLNERYEKKKAEFEAAWAEYQESKDNLALMKKIYEALEIKYQDSESDFENNQVTQAKKNFTNADISTTTLLSKCRDVSWLT